MLKIIGGLSMAVVLFTFGCAGRVSPQDIVGSWVTTSQSHAKRHEAAEKSTLQLNADGSCVVKNVPDLAREDIKEKQGYYISGKGRWRLKEEDGRQIVRCNIEHGYEFDLDVRRKDGNLRLFFYIGDPDSWDLYEYEKQE